MRLKIPSYTLMILVSFKVPWSKNVDLEVLIENGVATLVMNRPEARNALSMNMRKQLAESYTKSKSTTNKMRRLKRCWRSFYGRWRRTMGESIKKSPQEIRKEFMLRIHDLHPIMFAMRRMPKPIIASCRERRRALEFLWP